MEICYIITNKAWPEWVKIGFTSKNEMKERLSVYQTGLPFRDYKVSYQQKFKNAREIEKEVHKRLKMMYITNNNEWFKISLHLAQRIIESVYDDLINSVGD